MTYTDRKVGELLAVLDETGLADNTVVVFTSDHGDMLCEKEMVQKRNLYEWSCRVPLLVRFPDGWKAETSCSTPVSLLDLLPTFCELAGEEAACGSNCAACRSTSTPWSRLQKQAQCPTPGGGSGPGASSS